MVDNTLDKSNNSLDILAGQRCIDYDDIEDINPGLVLTIGDLKKMCGDDTFCVGNRNTPMVNAIFDGYEMNGLIHEIRENPDKYDNIRM